MRTTPWFDMSVEPVRDGVYLLRWKNGLVFYARFWRGYWRTANVNHSFASRQTNHSVGVILGDAVGWCGLAEKPE